MKIFTNEQIRAIDRYTTEKEGISSLTLIERVADSVSCEITSRWRLNQRIIIFAGPGTNGAYALAVGRKLYEQGYYPEIYLFNIGGDKLCHDCITCRDQLLRLGSVHFTEIVKTFTRPELSASDVVIDGLFGTDLNRPLEGGYVILVRMINESGAFTVSIDIPSGMIGDWNSLAINRNIINANLTLAVQFPRLAFFLADNAQLIGEWKVMDINLSPDEIRRTQANLFLVQNNEIKPLLHRRDPFSSKADYGTSIIFAGSFGMMGAAVLATRGAIRAGVGKVTTHSPKCGYYIMQSSVPSALFDSDANDMVISDITLSHNYNSVAIGPGIGTSETTINALEGFLKIANANSRPVILDADALNCIAARPTLLNYIPVLSILTPHEGEFDRLFGAQTSAEARLQRAVEVAKHHRILIILKGRYTAIVRPDGKIYFNSSGTPAMATPGSGDVLTGVLAGFLAQGFKPEVAALIAVYVHGIAGQLAEAKHGEYGVAADDIAANIGRAIKSIMD
jgi:NAD(P)H-hydrate epimerase